MWFGKKYFYFIFEKKIDFFYIFEKSMIYFSIFNIYHSIFFRIFRVANTSGEIKK